MKRANYFIRIGDSISQLFNVIVFNGDPNYSISGESYRLNKKTRMKIIDGIFIVFEKEHCRKAYDNDILKAKILLEQTNT